MALGFIALADPRDLNKGRGELAGTDRGGVIVGLLEHVLSESRFIRKVQSLRLQAKGLGGDHKIVSF